MKEGIVKMQAEMFALVAEMHSNVARIEAMKVANQTRIENGQALAYDESCFVDAQNALTNIASRLRTDV